MGDTIQRVWFLKGLGCANCAAKIEDAVGKSRGVHGAVVDFATTRLTVRADAAALDGLDAKIAQIVRDHEPGVQLQRKQVPGASVGLTTNRRLLLLVSAFLLLGAALYAPIPDRFRIFLFLTAYLVAGGDVLMRAFGRLRHGRVFDENFLMSIATLGAFAIREYPEGVAVMLFFKAGEYFQELAVCRSRRSIAQLMDIRPKSARVQRGAYVRQIAPEKVQVGDMVVVRPGERVPLDGHVIAGTSSLDTSALTGESVPQTVVKGSEVRAGSINGVGLLKVHVDSTFAQSTVAKILDLVENASARKAKAEHFITKFARVYTPIVVSSALMVAILPPLVLKDATFADWIYRSLVFLIISCPCALVVSIPLSFYGGIGSASRQGILVKGGNYLEAFNEIDTAVFDKTGTLTKGRFSVVQIEPAHRREHVLQYAALAEMHSSHPIAAAIRHAFSGNLDADQVTSYQEIPGQGVTATIAGKHVVVGSATHLKNRQVSAPNVHHAGTIVHVAVSGRHQGYLVVADETKPDAPTTLRELRRLGIKTVMLSGDNPSVAQNIGDALGVEKVYGGLMPDEKVSIMETLLTEQGKVVYVGDGINDAPVLARADIGIAMGGLGSDAAIEAADVVLMKDEPSQLLTALDIAGHTRRIVWQNIVIALGVKALFLVLGAMGIATLWEAVFADVGVTLIAIMNATRSSQPTTATKGSVRPKLCR